MSNTSPPSARTRPSPALQLLATEDAAEIVVCGQPSPGVAEALHVAIAELLPPDIRRREQRLVAIDEVFSWRLEWRDGTLIVTVLDEARAPVAPPIQPSLHALIDAIYHAALGQGQSCLRALDRLRRWAQALEIGDLGPTTLAIGRRAPRRPEPPGVPRPKPAPLPVRGLRHLAYREAWASLSHGTVTVIPQADRVQVFYRDGVRIIARANGGCLAARDALFPVDAPNLALDPDCHLVAFDDSAVVRWRSVPVVQGSVRYTVTTEDAILLEGDRDVLSAFDPDTGRLLWRHHAFTEGGRRPYAAHGTVWSLGDDGFLYGLRLDTGELHCRRRLYGQPLCGPRALGEGLVVCAAVGDAVQVTHFDDGNGEVIWLRRIRGRLVVGPVGYPGGIAFVIESDGHQAVHQLRSADGTQLARHELDDSTEAIRVDVVGRLLLTKSITGAVWAFAVDGEPRWRLGPDEPHHPPWARLAPTTARGLLLCAGATIRAVDPSTGRIIQTLDCADLTPSWVSVWDDGDLLVLEDDMLRLFRLHGHLALVD